MSRTLRFPLVRSVPNVGPAEPALVVTLLQSVALLSEGGSASYVDVSAWRTVQRQTEAPYGCVAVEFTANTAMVIGNGTFAQQIGLFGAITNPNGTLDRTLLGVLGIARGGVAPQIPISTSSGALVGYTQMVSHVAVYDFLSVGGVTGDISFDEGQRVTVRARPIRAREYLG